MWNRLIGTAAVAAAVLAASQTAQASSLGGSTAGYIVAGQPTLAPFAHVRFCLTFPGDCAISQGLSSVELGSSTLRQLASVNGLVNSRIHPVEDASTDAGDVWQVGVASGDCEEFALTKRRNLIALGWPSRALRIAVARTGSGEGHAVLVVKTSRGDLVLDNRTDEIKPWTQTDLRWVKIQSGDNPRLWYTM